MTLAEKFGQLEMSGPTGANGAPGKTLLSEVRNGQVGSVLDLVGVNHINQVQRAALQSRLHIPVIFALDVIHGYKTIFPVPIAEASSWDPAAVENDESISADEATADGIKWTFNPMVNISRDPRWGRVVEGSGEDPYLGSAMAAAKVRGYQGSNFSAPDKMAATVKHFAAYGAPVAGREYNTVNMSTQQLLNDYLPPYKAAIDAGAASVMSAFNSLNGVPSSANPYLLTTILRHEWGFGGTVVSDYQAIQELIAFGFAANGADAARLALTAGVDIEMGVQIPSQYATYPAYGPGLVRSGKVSMATIDSDVRHVLTLKYLAGMFAHPLTDPSRVKHAELTPAHLAAARAMAGRSMVLLRNSGHALPLSTERVVGGGGRAARQRPVRPARAGRADRVLARPGQGGAGAGRHQGGGAARDGAVRTGLRHLVHLEHRVRRRGQGSQGIGCDRGRGGRAGGRQRRGVLAQQDRPAWAAARAGARPIAATGKPYVVVLMNGRPLTISWLARHAPALLESWFPGTEGGNAVADVLFGRVNPGGKLPMSFPRDVGQIPISYNELPTGRPYDPNNKYTSKYLDVANTPQYPFGFGLSYTTFALSNLHLSAGSIARTGTLTVTADITNTGTQAG